jgi:hypothetical protein
LIDVQLLLSDTKTYFSKEHAWQAPGDSGRNARWAIVIEKDGTVSYAEVEPTRGVTVCFRGLSLPFNSFQSRCLCSGCLLTFMA